MQTPREADGWDCAPAPDQGVYYPLLSPKPGADVVAVILTDSLFGVYTHFVHKQTRPCLSTRALCEGCTLNYERRWKGYLGVWQHHKGRLALAEITLEGYLRCPQFEVYKGQLRGKILRLTRNGEAKNARVCARLTLYAGEIGTMPPAFNVRSALERVWLGRGAVDAPQVEEGKELFNGDAKRA